MFAFLQKDEKNYSSDAWPFQASPVPNNTNSPLMINYRQDVD